MKVGEIVFLVFAIGFCGFVIIGSFVCVIEWEIRSKRYEKFYIRKKDE